MNPQRGLISFTDAGAVRAGDACNTSLLNLGRVAARARPLFLRTSSLAAGVKAVCSAMVNLSTVATSNRAQAGAHLPRLATAGRGFSHFSAMLRPPLPTETVGRKSGA